MQGLKHEAFTDQVLALYVHVPIGLDHRTCPSDYDPTKVH
jgi:hypothetical protein